ncbi:MAG: T9SS type A sorting domain-containing protein, partial [Flavobacteriales bacterium]
GIEDNTTVYKPFSVYNSAGFTSGKEPLQIVCNQPFGIKLFNAVGQQLLVEENANGNFSLNGESLSAGVYVVEITVNGAAHSVKLVKH